MVKLQNVFLILAEFNLTVLELNIMMSWAKKAMYVVHSV